MIASRPPLGILMLDSLFPRIPGDIGNPETWDFPVRYAVVENATPETVVCDTATPLFEAFVDAGKELVAQGCVGLATTCGFLAPMRQNLADRLGVPVAASALEQAAQIQMLLPADQKVAILTISKRNLSCDHLNAANVPETALIVGVDSSSFAKSILNNQPSLDVDAARAEVTKAALDLQAGDPNLGAILLECTNMVPYAPAVATATGLPVYSIYSHLIWFYEGLAPTAFPPDLNQPSQKV